MKHVILGAGNLGKDLYTAIQRRGEEARIFSKSTGYDLRYHLPIGHLSRADAVWVTVGAGSVETAEEDASEPVDLFIKLPLQLAQKLRPEARLFIFSTDYLCEPLEQGFRRVNLYADIRHAGEILLQDTGRKGLTIFRVGSLYGLHKPLATFPGKLCKRDREHPIVALPENVVIPTPTEWLAEEVFRHFDYHSSFPLHLSPSGSTTTREWGELVLGRPIAGRGYDVKRPKKIEPIETGPSWRELWDKYGWRAYA